MKLTGSQINSFNHDGFIECLGRKDNQIKISGRRIEIGEIEYVLSKFSQTKDAIVVPVRDNQQIVISCIAFTENKINNEEVLEIRSKSLQFLDKVFFPKKIISIEKFPLTISGKIDRRKLEELLKI